MNAVTPDRGEPVVDFDDVFVLHPGHHRDVAALRGLSIQVRAGERVVVHGPSGSGKSTLMRLVSAELRPNAGSARLFGRELTTIGDRARAQLRRESIGIVTQHSGDELSPELTCLDNVALQPLVQGWSRRASREAALAALAGVGLDGYGDRRLSQLSHGELQRVAIAAALAHRPKLLVADEPTGQLDVTTADIIFDLLAKVADAQGATLIVATHDAAAIRIAHRVLTISDGRVCTEHRRHEAEPSLVVDRHGWLRLPTDAALGDRVRFEATPQSVVLTAVSGFSPQDDRPDATATQLGESVSIVEDASYELDGTQLLRPVSADFRAGALTVITGRSGSGKTTLLALASGWLRPSTGTVRVHATAQPSACAAVPIFADDLGVEEALVLALVLRRSEVDRDRIRHLLAALALSELTRRRVSELSGGERQRLAVARCLVTGARLLVFDEPTAQLDRASADRVVNLLVRAAREGASVVCATHDRDLIEAADRVVDLDATVLASTLRATSQDVDPFPR